MHRHGRASANGSKGWETAVSQMQRTWLLALALLVGVMVASSGCDWLLGDKLNPEFCAAHPDNQRCRMAFPDAGGCTASAQCMAPTPVCSLPAQTCVQCTATEHDACTRLTPACGADNACRACAAHTECPSSACLPDGSCGTDVTVAYVDPMSSGTSCTLLSPCAKISDALKLGKPFVKLHGTINEQVLLNTDVTLLADPGTTLTDTMNGILIKIDGMIHVAIYDLMISGASGMNNPGISLLSGNAATVSLVRATVSGNAGGGISATGGTLTVSDSTISTNPGGGISATGGATITVSQSKITGNVNGGIQTNGGTTTVSQCTISGNANGGIQASGGTLSISQSTISGNVPGGGISAMNSVFVIVGNVVFNNGGNASLLGGISIGGTMSAVNRLEFNTIVLNTALDNTGSGVHCLVPGTFTARDNIIADNHNPTQMMQIDGGCMHVYSLVRPGTPPTGTGNIGDDPKFVNEVMGDLHLQTTSPARGKADPSADLTGIAAHDIDGDARVAPADLGADQVKP